MDSRIFAVPPLVRVRQIQDAGDVAPGLHETGDQRRLCRPGRVPVKAVKREGVHRDAVQQMERRRRQLALPAPVCFPPARPRKTHTVRGSTGG